MDLQKATDIVYALTSYTPLEDSQKDFYINVLLETFSGLAGLVRHYRPWYVAAQLLSQDIDQQSISRYDVTEFTNLESLIQSLYQTQYAYDLANNLVLPDGTSALLFQPIMCINTI
jgi:hypothetical protein